MGRIFSVILLLLLSVNVFGQTLYEWNHTTEGYVSLDPSPTKGGQVFTIGNTGTNQSFVVDSIAFYIHNAVEGVFTFELFSLSGGYPTGSALSSKTVYSLTVGYNYIDMPSEILYSSTSYAIILTSSLKVNFDLNFSEYSGGSAIFYDSGTWSDRGYSSTDLLFEIYGHRNSTITTHPVSQTKCVGQSVTFTVGSDAVSPTYQWKKNGSNISGQTSSSYTISSVASSDAANYTCTVTESALGVSTTSNAATLTVPTTTSISSHPSSISRCTGTSATFSVTAAGSGLTYQWKKNGTNISGATSTSYTISSVATGDAADYTVTVTGTCGTVTSNVATLTVNTSPSITDQPDNLSIYDGDNATFSVTASGTSLTYQWRKEGIDILGATSNNYTITGVDVDDIGNYDVIISNECGNTTSNSVTLNITNCIASLLVDLSAYFKFEETTGSDVYSEVNDAVLNGVIAVGTSINQTGKIGKCYSYTTNGDGVMMSDVEEIQMYNSDCAISAWIYATTLTNTEGGYAFTIVGGQETDAAMFYVTPTSGLLRLNGYNISAAPISDLVVTINTWHHVGFSYDQTANELTYFMDGEFDTVSYSHEFDPGASSAYIGKSMSDAVWDVNDFVGKIDEVGIWKRKLTIEEIEYLYNSDIAFQYPFCEEGTPPIISYRKKILLKNKHRNILLANIDRDFGTTNESILLLSNIYGYDSTYALASTQKFAIPENVENGDYVGYWRRNWTWMSGNSITYTIETNYNNAFTVNSSTGLISIADYSIINGKVVQQDTLINIIIRTTDPVLGYELDTAKIWVKENSYCKFYDFTTSGTGTRASPYNDMDAVAFAAGYGYFLKRGTQAQTGETTVLTALIGTSANPTIFAAYGQGEKPKFVGAGTEGTECFFLGNSTDAVNGRCEYLYFYDIAIRHYGSSAWKARTYTNNVGWYNCDVYNNSLLTEYPALSINDQTYADSIIQRPFEFINHVSDTCPSSHIKCGNGPLRISNIYCYGGTDGVRFALGNNGYIKHAYINRTLTGASDDAGIQIRGDNILIEDVRILNGNGAGIDITSTTTSGFLGMPDNVKVKNAYINGVGGYGIGIWKPDASSMTGVNDTIEDCIIANAGTRGIRINSGGGHVIQRNIIYGSGNYGIYAYSTFPMNNLKIYYNIIYNSSSTDLYLQNGSGHTVYNNDVDGSAIFTSSTTTVRNNIFNTISGGNTVSNNLLIPDISTASYFIDYNGHNYRLKSTATNAINAGYDVGIDYDIAGNAVSSPPEIGAYEYEE